MTGDKAQPLPRLNDIVSNIFQRMNERREELKRMVQDGAISPQEWEELSTKSHEDGMRELTELLGSPLAADLAFRNYLLTWQLDSTRAGAIRLAAARKAMASTHGKKAAHARHSKPGGAVEKAEAIRAAWASGKYSSRTVCAEQECAHLGISFDSARKALRNTPDPA